MIKEKAMELADALESGKFKQGIGKLKQEISGEIYHCCLGVASELSGKDWNKWFSGIYTLEGFTNRLPYSVRNKFGMYSNIGFRRDGEPLVINGEEYHSLAHANDQRVPFKDQAAYIRKNYQYL